MTHLESPGTIPASASPTTRFIHSFIRSFSRIAVSANMPSIFTIALLASVTLARGDDTAGPSHVTCGSVIKLRNSADGRHLHSLQVNYGSGSGQQAVVGTHAGDSSESMWVVRDDGGSKSQKKKAG